MKYGSIQHPTRDMDDNPSGSAGSHDGQLPPALSEQIPTRLTQPGAIQFWVAALLTGISTGVGAIVLTLLLEGVQHLLWPGHNLLDAALHATIRRHLLVLLAAGVVTGAGQLLLKRLTSGNGIDTTAAIWFHAGRMPPLRTLGSAVLSVIIVGMGVSMGREGAPKQAGAVFADFFADRARLSEEQRRLLVACGAGAGMGAAYGVPLGGAMFSLEVMRGVLALRYVLPAMVVSLVATGVSWLGLANAKTYDVPAYPSTIRAAMFAIVAGAVAGVVSVGYVKLIAWADRHKPQGSRRFIEPIIVMTALGAVSIWYPQLLGNGKDVSQLAFTGELAPLLLLALLFLKPAATALCMKSGAPGGLFTPSLTTGALLGGLLGYGWRWITPDVPLGLCALLCGGAVIAATTQGPISAMVLMMELTGRDRSFMLPMLLAITSATMVARTITPRSIYDARLSDEEFEERRRAREAHPRSTTIPAGSRQPEAH
jgi:chloride channel protein, CIC family